ncbi:MAG: right-handed parallel beta-helix repeat-containing protein [Planctomycetota bacterium]|jgi:parallel beta-helix repeat protein
MRNLKNLTLCVLMPVLVSTAAVADIHYVNPGESIQAAIDAADPGDEIEVAPGTYSEAINFNGNMDIRLYSSGGPEVTTIDGTGHYHVVQCISGEGSGTVLEGFTITGGNATGSMWDQYGGGMLNYNESSPTVTNCIFDFNNAYAGGGMYNEDYSSPTVTNCTFTQNTAVWDGGGMHNDEYSSSTVTNCTFTDNTASWDGGGMYIGDYSSPTVTNCIFTGNAAGWGGGMYNDNSSPAVTNCTFTGNTADYGGGMYNYDNSPTVTNCTFTGNTANDRGGGMFNSISTPTVTNCTFTGNTANYGGGMSNFNFGNPTVTNCTFTGNTANDEGGGMYNESSSPTVTNCILWDDSPNEILDDDTSSTTVTYSDVQGGTGETWFGEGCIDTDPMFADVEGRLLAFSPCLDAGNDDAVPPGVTTDLDGNPRIQGVCVDMGAFESDLNYMDPGWIFMPPDAPDFGYSLNEADLLYFYSFDFVQSFNLTTGGRIVHMPTGWIYVDWPFYFESDSGILWFALPPDSGLWVYHFSTGQWEVLPRIIPW